MESGKEYISMSEQIETVVIGGGQAGLSVGYFLKQQGRDFVILDAHERIGDAWRTRWDSLRLFTPARFSGLAGMRFPAPPFHFPTKDEMADYLESYARHFNLPVRTGVRVEKLTKEGNRFIVVAGDRRFEAENVVVAMINLQRPRVPAFASALDPKIVQLHSFEYRNPSQLREGGVLIAGVGNSGADIAMEVVRHHHTWLSGRDTGHIPFRIESWIARIVIPFLFRVIFHRLATVKTPVGRKMRAKYRANGHELIRVKPQDLIAAGVERVPKTAGVQNGLPLLEDGRVLDVANVIWCTGYQPNFSWIDLPVLAGELPQHERGVVASVPGLYFVGLEFLYAASSSMIQGVGRDAEYIAKAIAARASAPQRSVARRAAHALP
jgi:putative flavoprotein involved in K+ transport